MQALKTAILTASVTVILLVAPAIGSATTFSAIIAYGDSLSDNGNLFSADQGIIPGGYPPSPPYFNGRFSNGPVAVEQMAKALGIPLVDFAVGGATSGIGNFVDGGTQTTLGAFGLPGMALELTKPLPPGVNVATSLFVVWGGANDFLAGGSPLVAAANIDAIVANLEAEGATHILVPGLPDLSLTPEFYGVAAAALYTQIFNQTMLLGLPPGATYYDTFAFLNGIEANPAAYGITNTNTPCLNGATPCANPGQYIFWDDIHPTTTVDALLAQQFAAAATPEPSTMVLLGTGIAGLAELIRRRRAA